MFSYSVIRRGRCSLARPTTATRCNAIVVDRGQPQTIRQGQQHAAIHRCLAGAAARAPPGRRGGVTSGEVAAGKMQGRFASCSGTKHNPVLGLGNEHPSFLSETTGGTVNWRQRASTLRRDDYCLSLRPETASSALRSRALQAGGSALRLDRRGFSAGQGLDGDHDGDDGYDNSSSGDSGSESECESERTLFGASGGAEATAKTEEAGAPVAVKDTPAKKNNAKPRIPRNRRGGKGERNPSPTAAAQAVVGADGEAGIPAPSPEAPEAPAKKAPTAKTPRKRRGNQGKSKPSPTAAAQAAEVADGEKGTTATEAADPPATSKAPKAKTPRKRRGSQGESARSPNAGPKDAERKGAADATDAGIYPRVPDERKAFFERARRAGVARRILEAGGALRDWDSDSDSGSSSEPDSGGEGDDCGVPDESPFPWKEAETPPFTWQEPDVPVAPKPFVAGSGADGETGGAAAGAEAKSTGGGGKATRRRGQRKKTQQQQQLREEHPVLGHLVADLKYKRVYVTSVEALEKVRVWEEGRTLRPVHAVEIFEGKAIEAQKLEVRRIKEDGKEAKDDNLVAKGMPGVITLYRRPLLPLTKRNQQYVLGIVDGQHRLRALKMLADASMWDLSERNVMVEVFDTKDERDIEELYAEINRAEPVQIDLDIPGPEEVYKCAEEVVLHLYKQFRPMFGGKRVRPPSLNAIAFRENLIRSGLIERHELFTPHLLLDFLLRVNEMMSKRDVQTWGLMVGDEEGVYKTKRALMTALKRANQHNFYLGMEMSWMLV